MKLTVEFDNGATEVYEGDGYVVRRQPNPLTGDAGWIQAVIGERK